MNKTTIIVAIITACSAIFPQIIIAIIKNHHDLKLRKFEVYEQSKRNSLINFINSATECALESNEPNTSQLNNFYKSAYILLTYFPEAKDILSEYDLNYICSNKKQSDIDKISKSIIRDIAIKLSKLLSEK